MLVKDAWWLARKELQFYKIPLGFSVLATILIAALISMNLEQSIRNATLPEMANDQFWFIDFVFVLVTPSLAAIFMSGPYLSFRAIKEDPFSKRMAFYRSLPIPIKILALSRTIIMLITLTLLSIVFYSTITIALHDRLFQYLTFGEYFTFVLIWLGYAVALGGMNPYIEYGTSGKVLHLFPYLAFVLFAFGIVLFYKIVGNGIVESTIMLSLKIGLPIAILFLLIGIVGCVIWHLLLTKRLSSKDYL